MSAGLPLILAVYPAQEVGDVFKNDGSTELLPVRLLSLALLTGFTPIHVRVRKPLR